MKRAGRGHRGHHPRSERDKEDTQGSWGPSGKGLGQPLLLMRGKRRQALLAPGVHGCLSPYLLGHFLIQGALLEPVRDLWGPRSQCQLWCQPQEAGEGATGGTSVTWGHEGGVCGPVCMPTLPVPSGSLHQPLSPSQRP